MSLYLDCKKWLLDNYTFFEDDGSYYLEFCLREEAFSFVKSCCKRNIPFAYFPSYGIAIQIGYLKVLIEKIEYEKETNLQMFPETHTLLKLH